MNDLQEVRTLSRRLHGLLISLTKKLPPGTSYSELYRKAEEILLREDPGTVLSTLDLNINSTVCHCSSPGRSLTEGDIITLDIVITKNGLYADGAWSTICGKGNERSHRLIEQAWETARAAVLSVTPGSSSLETKKAVHNSLAGSGFSLLTEACGHGIGTKMHMPPDINFSITNKDDVLFKEGMIFTIEPVISRCGAKLIYSKEKEWRTDNLEASAYFEHMVAINENKSECLNLPEIIQQKSIDIFQQII
ncbi:MAG: M24 family metallopeptidase [Spirochaetales bacterium]|nr:M24 family metallopeptidase [Spirochaetales bacterium]